MTPASFTAWRATLGLSQAEAANSLGVVKSTIQRYEAGSLPIPLAVQLATRYLLVLRVVGP